MSKSYSFPVAWSLRTMSADLTATPYGVPDAHAVSQPSRHLHQEHVSLLVAEFVVHRLEVVEVDEQQTESHGVPVGRSQDASAGNNCSPSASTCCSV
jgi:hypothetical protein